MKLITYGGIIRNISISFNITGVTTLIVGVTFLVFEGAGGKLTLQKIFTTLSLFYVLKRTSITFIVFSFFNVYEGFVAIKRIQVSHCYPGNDVKNIFSGGRHRCGLL